MPEAYACDVAADVARVGLWHWDLASGVMYIDSRSAFAHGVPIEHPAEDFIARVIHQDDAASFRTALTQALSSPHLTSHQLRVVDRDGHSRAVEIRMRVIRDMKAQALHVVLAVASVTAGDSGVALADRQVDAERGLVERLSVATQ